MMITIHQLRAGITNPPDNLEEFIDPLNEGFDQFNINTNLRIAGFLGQAVIETDGFKKLREHMNYLHHSENKRPRLALLFPDRFTDEEALKYEGKPEQTANRAYSNKLGNGSESSGDGFKYRGGGLFHLTGKGQYNLCGVDLKVDFINGPQQIEIPRYAVLSACWYWKINDLNRYADRKSWELLTKSINKEKLKLDERLQAIEVFLDELDKS